jgi:Na+-translocating ferredoxin:NAD+ oxidoreductase subunit B
MFLCGLWHSVTAAVKIEDNSCMKRNSPPALVDTRDPAHADTLATQIEDLLPQTQCTKCGYSGCRPYAQAIAAGAASYNQCPPGGQEGVERLAKLLGKPVIPLNPVHGLERPRPVARIDEALCIGCTLCIQACPVDAILGAPKQMHTIISDLCTGCDLCVSPCPVDCIEMFPVTGHLTGWQAWTQSQADAARARHEQRLQREASTRAAAEARARERAAARHPAPAPENLNAAAANPATQPASSPTASPAPSPAPSPAANPTPGSGAAGDNEQARKRAVIQAALERARLKKEALAASGLGPKNTEHVSAEVQAQIDAAEQRRLRLGLGDTPAAPQPSSTAEPEAKSEENPAMPTPSQDKPA